MARADGRRRLLAALLAGCVLPARAAGEGVEAVLLAASTGITATMFAKSVVLAARAPGGETVGLILNQPLDAVPPATLAAGGPAFRGGPLANRAWFALAEAPAEGAGLLAMGGGIAMAAGDSAAARLIAASGAGRKRLFRGYAGWAPGQLGDEVRGGFWIARAVEADLVFDTDPATLWSRLAAPRRAVRRPWRTLEPAAA